MHCRLHQQLLLTPFVLFGCFSVQGDTIVPIDAIDPPASCNANFTVCAIPENILLRLPFTAIAGDVVLTDPNSIMVSDVFRIFDNIFNTGAGTGLGNMAFLFSSDDSTPLPDASTYSANAVFIAENPSGITSYLGNGTNYRLAAPEPHALGFLTLAATAMAILARRRSRTCQGDDRCDRGN